MLRIRFSRTGKVGQPSYRIVVAEHTSPVKGRYLEMLGHYSPARNPKVTVINKERIAHWVSKGAKPSESVASLLKKEGVSGMEKYLVPGTHKRKKKGEEVAAAKPADAVTKPAAEAAQKTGAKEAAPVTTA